MMVNVLEAKTNLSKLLDAVESGRERDVVIARNGRPVARLVPLEKPNQIKFGLFDGEYIIPEPSDELDAEVARLFEESEIFPPGTGW